jgi:hypothetical protein
MIPSRQGSLAARGIAVLQRFGGWVSIHPEQTWVATSIRGLGACKSTFCPAERRELPAAPRAGAGVVPLLAALAAAAGVLAACASDRTLARDVTDPGQFERASEDCQGDWQNRAAPVRREATASLAASAASPAVRVGVVEAPAAREPAGSERGSDGAQATPAAAKTAFGKAEPIAAR